MDETSLKISPRARRLARDLGVEMEELSALGKRVIREEDVRAVAADRDARASGDTPGGEEGADLLAAFAQSEAAALPKQVVPLTVTGEPYLPPLSETAAPPERVDGAAPPGTPPALVPAEPPLDAEDAPPASASESAPGGGPLAAATQEVSADDVHGSADRETGATRPAHVQGPLPQDLGEAELPQAPPEEAVPDDFEVLAEGALSETGRRGDGETGGEQKAETGERAEQQAGASPLPLSARPPVPPSRHPPVSPSADHPLTPSEPELLPLSPIRRVIAERALASVREVPQFPLWIDVDTGALLRETGGDALRSTSAWVQAVARTLEAHPRLNATFTAEGILLHRAVHVGVTLPLEDGIVVPVLHDAGRKSLEELAEELKDLEERARTRRLRGEHLAGATFSLADWSAFGVRGGVPLIHPPQVAALGIGVPRDVPLIRDGGLFVRTTSEVVLVSDQRALDAAHAAAFLTALRRAVER